MVSVPVKLSGFAKGVQEGGKLNLDARRLNVKGLLNDHVDVINLAVDDLAVGQSIRVSDIKLDKLTFVEAPNRSVASVKITRQAKEAETSAAAAAPGTAPAAAEAPKAPAK
jgi:large subunit ribosomal protein L25